MTSVLDIQELTIRCRELISNRKYDAVDELLAPLSRKILFDSLDLCLSLASAWSYTLRHQDAKELLNASRIYFLSSENGNYVRSWQNAYAVQLITEGRLVEAEALLVECLKSAESHHHNRLVAFSCNSLGIISSYRGDLNEAIYYYSRAITGWQQLGDRRGVAFAHYNMAVVLREWMILSDAATHFFIAQEFFSEEATREERVFTTAERAMLLLCLGDARLAERTALKALEMAEEVGNAYLTAASKKILGSVLRIAGELDSSRAKLESASEIAKRTTDLLLAAEIHEELSMTCMAQHDFLAAKSHFKVSFDLFARLGATNHCDRLRQRFLATSHEPAEFAR